MAQFEIAMRQEISTFRVATITVEAPDREQALDQALYGNHHDLRWTQFSGDLERDPVVSRITQPSPSYDECCVGTADCPCLLAAQAR